MHASWWVPCVAALLAVPLVSAGELQTFDETFDLSVTELFLPGSNSGFGGNCVFFDGTAHVSAGTVTATWTPQSPLTERLEIVIIAIHDDGETQFRQGGLSPLTVEFTDLVFQQTDIFFSAAMAVQLDGDGVALQQPVVLDVDLDYESEGTLTTNIGGCTIG